MKVAYNILHKLGTKQEPMVRPGDRVSALCGAAPAETLLSGVRVRCLLVLILLKALLRELWIGIHRTSAGVLLVFGL